MTQERADEIVRKVIYARLTVMPELNNSVEAFNVGRMIGQMQRQLEIELVLEVKPDVVERSKIDKAIAEIENAKMYRGNPKGLPNDIGLDRYFDKGLMKAIEILKRNIGEFQ